MYLLLLVRVHGGKVRHDVFRRWRNQQGIIIAVKIIAPFKGKHTMCHTIGGREYALTMWPNRWTLSRLIKTSLKVISAPIWMPLGAFYVTFQFVSPWSWRARVFDWFSPHGMEDIDKAQNGKRKVLLQHVSGRVLARCGCWKCKLLSLLYGRRLGGRRGTF